MASVLAEKYPETSAAAERGTAIHEEIAAALRDGKTPTTPEAVAAVAFVRGFGADAMFVEEPLELRDPETNELITSGTPDVVLVKGNVVYVIDHKTGRPEHVEPPESNLQLMTYAFAAATRHGKAFAHGLLLFLDGDQATPVASRVGPYDLWAAFDRIRKAAAREASASFGPWCGSCWQRTVCGTYRERAALALTLLSTTTAGIALTNEQATELALRVRTVQDACKVAEDIVKAHVMAGGVVEADGNRYQQVTVSGRRTGPSVAELQAQGLSHLVKQGQPFTKWEWRRP